MSHVELAHSAKPRILGCASQGAGSGDDARLRELLSHFDATYVPFSKTEKRKSFFACLRLLKAGKFDLFALEGTGFAAGLAAILGRLLWNRPYVISSGDAVAPFLGGKLPAGSPIFSLYERLLYTCSAGFIGWTPYLVGRALTMGAHRGITVPGWASFELTPQQLESMRNSTRQRLGIPEDAVVFGIAGSLAWSKRYQFCYGAELVRAAARCSSPPFILVVGDGSGLPELKRLAGKQLGRNVLLPGRVPKEDVLSFLAAMDFGSLPQSVDGVGSFRYTTKLPEYRTAQLLIVTNQIPMAYDLDRGDILRLRGDSPWSELFIEDLAALMQFASTDKIRSMKRSTFGEDVFERRLQIDRVTAFLNDLIENRRMKTGTA